MVSHTKKTEMKKEFQKQYRKQNISSFKTCMKNMLGLVVLAEQRTRETDMKKMSKHEDNYIWA